MVGGVLLAIAAFSVVALVVLELMREVLILRTEVRTLYARLEPSLATRIGYRIELDAPFALPDDWFIMSFVSQECAACVSLDQTIKELVAAGPELAGRFVFVDQGLEPLETPLTHLESGQRMIAPDLFRVLGVVATPTSVLMERREDAWILADLVEGADTDWLLSRLEEREHAAASKNTVDVSVSA